MTAEPMHGFSRALCDALAARNVDLLTPYLSNDVEWAMYGPIELFPFFGQRKGHDAVLSVIREMSAALELKQCSPESRLVDGGDSASLVRLTALHAKTGRTLSVRLALFITAENGQLTSIKVLLDTLDAAEQALGRELDLSQVA